MCLGADSAKHINIESTKFVANENAKDLNGLFLFHKHI